MEGVTLEKLQVVIEAYTKPYRDELEKVKRQTGAVTAQVEKQTGKMSQSFKKVGIAVASVVSVGAIAAFAKSCVKLGSDLQEVQNVVDVTFGDMNRQVDAFAKNAIAKFGLSELTAKKYIGTYGAMAKSFGIVGQAGYEMSAAIAGLTGDVASFYNLSTDEAYTKLKSIFTGETESLKELGVVMTQTALDQYALNNGFGRTTAKMTEQEKVMLRYRFVMDSLSDASGDFARTSGSWANQVRVLALQFESLKATIGQGLINAFTPIIGAINTLLAKLQTLANYFKAFTQALFGKSGGGNSAPAAAAKSMARAAGSSGAVADNMDRAAGAAKKMKEYTLGIDELNVLSPDDADSGGSGGGDGGGAPDFGDMSGELFGNVTVNPEIDAALERMQNLLAKLKEIAKPTTDAIKRLWNEGLARLGKFTWTALEDFWKYFLEPLGKWTLGEGLPRFFNITNDFLKAVNWDKINEALRNFWQALEPFAENAGEGLLNFYQDLSGFGADFINIMVPGGINALAAALRSIDAEHAQKIGYALGVIGTSLTALKIASKIAAGIRDLGAAIRNFPGIKIITDLFSGGVLTGLQGLLQGLGGPGTASFDAMVFGLLEQLNASLDRLLPDWVTDFLGKIWAGFSIGAITGSAVPFLGVIGGGIVGAILGGVKGALDNIQIDGVSLFKILSDKLFNFDTAMSLFNAFKDNIEKVFADDTPFLKVGENIVLGIVNGIGAALAFLLEPIGDLLDWIIQGICNIFGIHSPAEAMKPYGKYILEGVIEGFRATFESWTTAMDEWYIQHITPWFTRQKWSDLYETIKKELKTKWDSTVGVWATDIKNWWNTHVAPWFTTEKWIGLYETIKKELKTKWDSTVGEWSEGVKNWWAEHVAPWFTTEKWIGLYESIKSSLGTTWGDTLKEWKENIKNWWRDEVIPWFKLETWVEAMKGIPGAFQQAFKGAVNAARTQINKLIDWLNDKLHISFDGLEIAGEEIIPAFDFQLFTIPHIPELADGGLVSSGQLFLAREAGPELVGSYGGKTGVLNNKQIVDAVSEGVAVAVADVLSSQGQGAPERVEVNLVVDGRTLANTVADVGRRSGFKFRPA